MGDSKTMQKRLQRARWRVDWDCSKHEATLTKAAEYFGLDPKDAGQRERLLYKLADALFGPPGEKGRPKDTMTSWGSRLVTLGGIYEEKKNENPKLSDAKIAKLIKQEHEEFKNDNVEQIRQRLRWAHELYRDWSYEAVMLAYELPEDWEPGEPDYDDYGD